MANLPEPQKKSSIPVHPRAKKIRKLLLHGASAVQAARIVEPDSKGRRKLAARTAYRIIATDPVLQEDRGLQTKGVMIDYLPQVGSAMARRAARGRVDAGKLVMEATGFHNPRVQHEHTGDIKVSISMPRPAPVETGPGKEAVSQSEIVDAEVVDE